MVFTGGVSDDSEDLEHESSELQSLVDKVFAFGIGAGANLDELKTIATDAREGYGWKVIHDFPTYQTLIRNFITRFGGCKTTKVKPYRKVISSMDIFEIIFLKISVKELSILGLKNLHMSAFHQKLQKVKDLNVAPPVANCTSNLARKNVLNAQSLLQQVTSQL